jgi:hypothetical protein
MHRLIDWCAEILNIQFAKPIPKICLKYYEIRFSHCLPKFFTQNTLFTKDTLDILANCDSLLLES